VLYWNNDDKVAVKITDLSTGLPVTDAQVLVSYYIGRDRNHPEKAPGEVLPGLQDLFLSADTTLGDGWYSTQVESASVPAPGAYVRVTVATTPAGANGHWEDFVTVAVRRNTDN
jgi:hypothetical protein